MNEFSPSRPRASIAMLLRVLASPPRALGLALCVAAFVTLPSLGGGLFVDDYGHLAALERLGSVPGVFEDPAELFTFATGDTEKIAAARRAGFFPWWTDDDLQLAFWRPLSVWSRRLDHALWGRWAPGMHAQSVLWGLLSVWLATLVLRRVQGTLVNGSWIAGVGAFLFAVDESRALPVVWVANRNAVIGLTWMVAALLAHVVWRETDRVRWLVVALGAALLGLLANEGAIAICAFVFAHALWLDRGALAVRLLRIAPYGVLVVVWRLVYQLLGYGVAGSPSYVDPLHDPLRFLEVLGSRLPVLTLGLFGNVPVMPYEFLTAPWKAVFWGVASVGTVVVAALVLRAATSSATVRFWGTALVLALIPAATTVPSGRLLGPAALATAALLAHAVVALAARPARRFVLAVVLVVHVLVAGVVHAAAGVALGVGSRAQVSAYQAIEIPGDAGERTAIVLDAPTYFATAYAVIYRRLHGLTEPKFWFNLAPNQLRPMRYDITRVDERTLRYSAPTGFPVLLFRNRALEPGMRIALHGLEVEVVEVLESGEASEVLYRFDRPLESGRYIWLRAEGLFGQRPASPPGVGETLHAGFGSGDQASG